MKNFRLITIAILITITSLGCEEKTEADLNPNLRTVVTFCDLINQSVDYRLTLSSITLNKEFSTVFKAESEAGEGSTFNLIGDAVSYSYFVIERTGTISSSTTKNYSGTLNASAFIKNQKNKINVIRDGSGWKLLVNGKNEDIGNGDAGGDTGGTSEIYNKTVTGNRKDRQYRTFNVPSGVKSMTVMTKETAPDAMWNESDLFVNEGDIEPWCADDPHIVGGYRAKKASLSNNRQQDVLTFINPGEGIWTVMLYNYNSSFYFSNLVVTITK